MKIIKFKGGLGNQLFQYAFLRNLELKHGIKDIKADFSYYSDVKNDLVRVPRIKKLNIIINDADKEDLSRTWLINHKGNPNTFIYKIFIYIENFINKQYYLEKNRSHQNIENLLNYNYYDGYWQSWKIVNEIDYSLRKEIIYKKQYSTKTNKIIEKIKKENAVFIGIRRGDYLSTKRTKDHYGIFDVSYYNKAIAYIKKNVPNPIFYVFSNDIEWVERNMKFDCEVVYRNSNEQTSDLEELFIMSSCQHAIIVNSTFYWWGAWLIENPKKIVIAPKKWFADGKPIDIIPDRWIKI